MSKFLMIIIVLGLIAAGGWWYISSNSMPEIPHDETEQVEEDENLPEELEENEEENEDAGDGGGTAAGGLVTFTGTIVCLPHKGDGPHTLECAFGLRATNGEHYALQGLWDVAPDITDTEVKVRVLGTFFPAQPNATYDIAGTLDVEIVQRL